MDNASARIKRRTAWRTGLLVAAFLALAACSGSPKSAPAKTATAAPGPAPVPAQATPAPPTPAPAQLTPTATPLAAVRTGPSTTAAPMRATPRPGEYLLTGSGFGAGGAIAVVNAASGAHVADLPAGIPAPDWSLYYTADDQDGNTTVKVLDPALDNSAAPVRQRLIPGDYQLPVAQTINQVAATDGLSPNGKWLVLAGIQADQTQGGFGRNAGVTNRFVVLDTAFTSYVRGVMLSGLYRFDAISNDGNWLYLLDNSTGNQGRFRSQVRVYDLKKEQLLDQPLSDQNGDVVFSQRLAAAQSPDGQWLYSLDGGTAGGQVLYALNLGTQAVRRLDLPALGGITQSGGAGGQFGVRSSLLLAPDGKTLYVASATATEVIAIDTGTLAMRLTAIITPEAGAAAIATPQGRNGFGGVSGGTSAGSAGGGSGGTGAGGGSGGTGAGGGSAGGGSGGTGAGGGSGNAGDGNGGNRNLGGGNAGGPNGGNGRRPVFRTAVLSPDGQALFVPGTTGLTVVGTGDLNVRGRYLSGMAIDSLAFSPDGTRLYALGAASGQIIRLDPRTGAIEATLDGPGQAAALLHVTTNP